MDQTSKVILALIAAGLWANLAAGTLAPAAVAGGSEAQQILMHVQMIANGICANRKLC